MKIVILGSCKYEPYLILAVPEKIPGKWNTEEGYIISTEKFYPAINQADEIWVYAPDGVGEHTQRDVDYAKSKKKVIRFIDSNQPCYFGMQHHFTSCDVCYAHPACPLWRRANYE